MQRLTQAPIWVSKVSGDLLLARVKEITTVGLQKETCLKVKVTQNNYYEYNRMFYVNSRDEWSLDPQSKCRIGDVVLIRRMPEQKRPTKNVQYTIEKIVFQHGNFIDPVTKKRVYGANEFADEVELRKELVNKIFNEPLEEDEQVDEEEKEEDDDVIRQNIIKHRQLRHK